MREAIIPIDIDQGLDTSTPFLQLHGTVFKGQHVSPLGTELLFTEDKGRTFNASTILFLDIALQTAPEDISVLLLPLNAASGSKRCS
jgi:hypothetical protein